MEAAQKHWFLLGQRLDFGARGQRNPPKFDPKPIKMRRWSPRAAEKRVGRLQKPILDPKITVLEAKKAILEAKMEVRYFS